MISSGGRSNGISLLGEIFVSSLITGKVLGHLWMAKILYLYLRSAARGSCEPNTSGAKVPEGNCERKDQPAFGKAWG